MSAGLTLPAHIVRRSHGRCTAWTYRGCNTAPPLAARPATLRSERIWPSPSGHGTGARMLADVGAQAGESASAAGASGRWRAGARRHELALRPGWRAGPRRALVAVRLRKQGDRRRKPGTWYPTEFWGTLFSPDSPAPAPSACPSWAAQCLDPSRAAHSTHPATRESARRRA